MSEPIESTESPVIGQPSADCVQTAPSVIPAQTLGAMWRRKHNLDPADMLGALWTEAMDDFDKEAYLALVEATEREQAADPKHIKWLLGTFENFRRSFDENISCPTQPVRHDLTSVLLLSWEPNGSDMNVKDELSSLEDVFANGYHFKVEQKEMKVSRNTNVKLNAVLSNWIAENDGPRNLCIIYYAGHGWGDDKQPGHLFLTNKSSQQSQKEIQKEHNRVAWHSTESLLRNTDADVLVIFDCCNAGALQGRSQHRFEFLGACGHSEYTPLPGTESFTSALVWALKDLLEKQPGGFDSVKLKHRITQADCFNPDKNPNPVLIPRLLTNEDHVWIAPSGAQGESSALSESESLPPYRQDVPMEAYNLQFRFSKRQNEEQMGEFAKALSSFIRQDGSNLGIKQIRLLGKETKLRDAVRLLIRRRRAQEALNHDFGDDAPEVGASSPPLPHAPAIKKDLERRYQCLTLLSKLVATEIMVKTFVAGISSALLVGMCFKFVRKGVLEALGPRTS